ncbi:MAG TPA: hypothetical protein VFM43_03770 [Gaiellaceae bacterium]|nr:hypothetical protein [Gaiellaceae bacterium]
MRALRLVALVTAAVAAGSISATARSTTAAPVCPALTGPGTYDTHVSPSAGPAGTTVTVSGAVPGLDERGNVAGQTATEVFAYWNLDLDAWTSVFTSPVAAVGGSAVQLLATQDVAARCSYRTEVTIPSAAPGTYPIEVLYRWQPGYPDGSGWGEASFAPASFRVTAG